MLITECARSVEWQEEFVSDPKSPDSVSDPEVGSDNKFHSY